jgi:hypothetical protein
VFEDRRGGGGGKESRIDQQQKWIRAKNARCIVFRTSDCGDAGSALDCFAQNSKTFLWMMKTVCESC